MFVILTMLVFALIIFMAACWVLSDANKEWKKAYRELQEKNEAATKEIISLQQRNYLLEAENKALKSNTKGNQEIICYTCADNGDCREGCRFTVGAKGCKKAQEAGE